uniref:Zgc:110782 n=1 Tax=Sinocyclocheilus rhinocerous TaxID=307959 RepID=A0A673I6H9_9TELE
MADFSNHLVVLNPVPFLQLTATAETVTSALRAGYRAFDTGAVYGYEAYLGQVLKELLPKYGLSCEDVFIISKLAPLDHGTRTEYIDLYLVHWPGGWATLEEFYASGQFRAIGVSNYNAKHIRELLMSCRVPPVVLQIECQPKLIQRELRDLCTETGIHFQAYSSLGKGALLREPEVMDIVRSCGRTPAQVLLRWAVQQGISVLPRSSQSAERTGI